VITPTLGSIVQKGKFAAWALALDKQLNNVDLPTFGSPTIPHFNAIFFFKRLNFAAKVRFRGQISKFIRENAYLCAHKSFKYKDKMKKRLLSTVLLLASVLTAGAQIIAPKETPQLEFALQLKVTLGETYRVGETQHGERIVIPITGGTFEGPGIKGTIINGGADYQLVKKAQHRTELEAIYSIRTDDGVYIHVRNRGIIYDGKDALGNPSFYFKAAPQFEAPADSRYAWLNNALFVCAPEFSDAFKGIILNVWRVK